MEDRSRRRARLVLIVGLVLAIIAAGATFFVASNAQNTQPVAIPQSSVIVAAREIPAKTALTSADLKAVKMNTDAVPPAATQITKPEDVLNKVTVVPIAVGEPILPSMLVAAGQPAWTVFPPDLIGPNGAPNPGTPSYRAMSITVSDAAAAGGAVSAGDLVDILYTLALDPAKYFLAPIPTKEASDISAHIVLERVPILQKVGAVYVIRVDATTAERIAYILQAGGSLQMLLRAPKDDRASGAPGATFKTVFPEFKFPIGEKIPIPQ